MAGNLAGRENMRRIVSLMKQPSNWSNFLQRTLERTETSNKVIKTLLQTDFKCMLRMTQPQDRLLGQKRKHCGRYSKSTKLKEKNLVEIRKGISILATFLVIP